MFSTTTPNMSLILPTIGLEAGPTYGTDQNNSFTLVDQHDHSPGKGVAITPAGININADLSLNGSNLTTVRTVRLSPQSSTPSGGLDLGVLYEQGVDLFYRDGSGHPIRITQSGSIAGTSGSIGGLASPASATYVSITPAFVFQSDANTPANLDGGSLTLRNITASSKGIQLNAPSGLANNYSVTFPAAPPGTTSIVQLDSSGNVSASNTLASATLTIGSGGPTLTSNGTTLVTAAAYQPTTTANAGIFATSSKTVTIINAALSSTLPVATAGITNALQIIRGAVDSTGIVTGGEGFSCSRTSLGSYTITFNTAFTDNSIVTANCQTGSAVINVIGSTATASVQTVVSGSLANVPFQFIAIGQR